MGLHGGEIVEMAIRRKGVCITELSRRMHVNRRTVYNWFQQQELRIEVICEIGFVIGYDFSQDFPTEFAQHGFAIMEELMATRKKADPDQSNSVHFWMAKYITLLEDYNKLLQQDHSFSSSENQYQHVG